MPGRVVRLMMGQEALVTRGQEGQCIAVPVVPHTMVQEVLPMTGQVVRHMMVREAPVIPARAVQLTTAQEDHVMQDQEGPARTALRSAETRRAYIRKTRSVNPPRLSS
jgi:hypothetical protein